MKIVHSPGRLPSRLGGALALAGLLLSGCAGQSSIDSGHRGDELLKQVQTAYEQARSYADAAELTQQSNRTGKKETMPFSVAFAKPNKLRVEASVVSVVCDGKQLWSSIAEEHLAGQVLFLPAPAEMSPSAIYRDPLLSRMLGGSGDGLPLPQLALLLGDQPLKQLFGDDITTKWLGDKSISGEDSLYHVVSVTASRGTFELWVDPKSHVLRRLEIIGPSGPEQELITVDFKGAALNGKIGDNAFKFEPPATAKLVDHFVLPPPGLDNPPSELLGQKPAPFKFVDGEGKPVDSASLDGRVVVFDMWTMSGEHRFETFPSLEKVYRKYRDNPKVAIFTVNNVDEGNEEVSSDTIRKAFASHGFDLPILRDPERNWRSVFKVEGWPTVIILGADGTVQGYERGFDANLAETLPKTIDQLLAGENLAELTLATYRRQRVDFARRLDEATVGVNQEIELTRAKIVPRSEPSKLKVEKLWTAANIKNPGNIVVYPDSQGQPRVAVFDGWRAIVELDGAGKTIARHEMDLPETGVATQLRTAVDGQGRRTFAAFAAAQHKLYLMDERWQPAGSYPEETRQGISDVQLADVDGDGQLEMIVGYFGEVGVQCASLAAHRIWANRDFDNVLSVAVLRRDPDGHCRILVGNERPALGVLDYAGTQLADIPVSTRPIDILVAANLASPADPADAIDSPAGANATSQGLWKLAALSATKPAEFVAVGLDFHGSELWSYPLPVGVRNTPCDILIAGHLRAGESGQWLLTGADGSIHILTAEGELLDHFHYGDELTGIGTMTVDGQGVLLVATASELTAWKVIYGDSPAGAKSSDGLFGGDSADNDSADNGSADNGSADNDSADNGAPDGDAPDADAPDLGSQASEPEEEMGDEPAVKTAAKPEAEAGE